MTTHLSDVPPEDDEHSETSALLDQIADGAPIPRNYLSWALEQGLVRVLVEDDREPTVVLVLAQACPERDENVQPGFRLPVPPANEPTTPSVAILY